MADKNFGVKQINLIGASGVPTIESPNNLNLNAINVAISTDLSIGGKINSNVYIGDGYSLGISTANASSRLTVVGDGSFTGVVTATSFTGNLTGVAEYTSEWILGADGVNNYTFSGPGFIGAENDPVLYLVRGQKYKFTNTMGAHPFRIQSTPNGSFGTPYTEGIINNDVSNGTLTWDVQFDSPSVLYYQCTTHANMGGTIYIIDQGGGDSYWTKTYAGLSTTSNVGIGTTNPQGTLQVGTGVTIYGNTGVVSATTFYGDLVGSILNATNLTGGTANASTLNVVGMSTIQSGYIQVPASTNIRIGNTPGGSGSGRNIGIGDQVLSSISGGLGRNIGIGELSYYDTTTGQYNIGIGIQAGQKITTGSYNVILGGYNGQIGLDLRTSSNNVVISDGQGNIRQYINSSGNVGIKTTIITEALTVAGVVSATSFYGTLNAGQLTGALPAIDGSSLIGVVATGTGVEVQEDGTPVGTAGTINFGTNVNVTFSSGIATVSGASSVSFATTAYSILGSPNVNLGKITSTDIYSSGIITATNSFNFITLDPGVGGNSTSTLSIVSSSSDIYEGSRITMFNRRDVVNSGGTQLINYNNSSGGDPHQYFAIEEISRIGEYVKQLALYDYQGEYWDIFAGTTGTRQKIRMNDVGVGIGTTNPTSTLTVSGNANFTGIVTASTFSGSASGLTNIPSLQLTGALPAIDGSALLNVTASGTGVVIEDDQVNVGSATTIDFGTGLDVTFSAGIATITASGGSLKSRTIVTGVTTSISNNGIGNTNITGFKSYALMKVGLSTAGWLRLYTDSASRAADVSRSVGEDPAPGSGVIAEVVTTGISTTQIISPFVMGGNLDNPADTTIYAAITNLSGSTQAITANLTILQLEE